MQGFSHYFHPYAGWPGIPTAFLRPVANAEYFLSSIFFGTHWNLYLLSTYLIQSALVGCTAWIAQRRLGIPTAGALGAALLVFLSPALGTQELYSTAFAFDLLAALFVLSGLNELLAGRLASAWLLFVLSLFTKETAFFALFAAAVAIFLTSRHRGARRLLAPVLFLLPYTAWIALRLLAFHSHGDTYALGPQPLASYLLHLLEDFGRWPFPISAAAPLKHNGIATALLFYSLIGLNVVFWVLAAFAAVAWWRMRRRGISGSEPTAAAQAEETWVTPLWITVLFCALSFAIVILIPNLSARFGATLIPLLILCLAAAAAHGNARLRRAAWGLLIVPAVLITVARAVQFPVNLVLTHTNWALAADYARKLSRSEAPVILLVNDASGGFASNESIATFTGFRGRLIRINDIWREPGCSIQPRLVLSPGTDGSLEIFSDTGSPCAHQAFLGAWVRRKGSIIPSRTLPDGISIHYTYPAEPGTAHRRFSSRLQTMIRGVPPGAVILTPDFPSGTYREIQADQKMEAGDSSL